MAEEALRFGVVTEDGHMSDVWKCWTISGRGHRDVYMTSRPLGFALKLSLHERGQWHIGFHSEKRDVLFSLDQMPSTRFLDKWDRTDSRTQPLVLAARVYFPWFSPTISVTDAPSDIHWLPCAPFGQAVEVAIFLTNVNADPVAWPGRDSLGTKLVGILPLEGIGCVFAVHRYTDTWPSVPQTVRSPRFFAGKSKKDAENANRLVAWGEESDGSISFVEFPVTIREQNPGSQVNPRK